MALFVGTALVILFKLPVETIGTRFGGIPSGFPGIKIPQFRVDLLRPLISPAITVAMLGAIESLMSAVVSDRMSGTKHNPNVELVGQGVANIMSPLFGGLPATGAIARTATNIRSGAKTPVSGMIHALTLLCDRSVCRAAGQIHSALGAGGDSVRGFLQHGRMGRNSGTAEAFAAGYRRVAHHVRADGIRGSDGGRRSRNDPRGAGLHPEGHEHDDGRASHRRVSARRPRAYPAAQGNSVLRRPSSASTARFFSEPPTRSRK